MWAALAWVLAAIAPDASVVQPLKPSGKWIVEYADSSCVLQRNFGEGDGQVVFGLRPFPIASGFELVLIALDRGGSRVKRGTVQMTSPAGRAVKTDYVSVALPKNDKRLMSFNVDRSDLIEVTAGTTLMIAPGRDRSIYLSPAGFSAALKALDACQTDLLKGWGVDAAAMAAITTPAVPAGPPVEWIRTEDYPSDAINAGIEGVVAILWTIGADGRVSDCKVVHGTGNASLDGAACKAIAKRGRYKPALGKDGMPTISWASRRVRWTLP